MTFKPGDILEAEADYCWSGEKVMWRKGQQARITTVMTCHVTIIPTGKRRAFEVPKTHPMKLVSRPDQ